MPVTPPPASGGGGGSVVFYDEGSAIGTGTILNFVGAGVTGTFSGGTAIATVAAGGGGSVAFYDEGVAAGTAAIVNVVGSGGTVAVSGGTATITISTGGDYVFISETELGADGTAITISSIPNTYRDLILVVHARAVNAGNDWAYIQLRVGDGSIDTGTNYGYYRSIIGTGTAADGAASGESMGRTMLVPSSTSTTDSFGGGVIEILGYADTAKFKVWSGQGYYAGAEHYLSQFGGCWRNAAGEIDQVQIYSPAGDLKSGSRLAVYGRT